jgi:hypothetical protein
MHVNNGAVSARNICAALGVPNPDTAVQNTLGPPDANGMRPSLYWLRHDVLAGMQRVMASGRDGWMARKRAAEEHIEELAASMAPRGETRSERSEQSPRWVEHPGRQPTDAVRRTQGRLFGTAPAGLLRKGG